MKSRIVGWREAALVGIGFAILTSFYLRITPERWLSSITPDAGDPLFNLAILRWGAARAVHGFDGVWSPTFFFPLPYVLTLSDHLLGPSILAAILAVLGLEPASVYDSLLLLAFAGSAFTCHLVFRWSGLTPYGACLGALAWSFSCFRWTALSHLQVLLALWVPVTLWAFDRLLAGPSASRAVRFTLAYAAHVSSGSYLGYMIHVPLLAILLTRFRTGRRSWVSSNAWLWLAASATVCFALVSSTFGPYVVYGRELGLRPKLVELADNLVTLRSYFTIGARTPYAGLLPSLVGEPALWFGAIPLLLALLGLASWFLRARPSSVDLSASDCTLLAFALLACLVSLLIVDYRLAQLGLSTRVDLKQVMRGFRGAVGVILLTLALYASVRRRRSAGEVAKEEDTWWRGLLAGGLGAALVSHAATFSVLRGVLPGLEAIRVPGRFFAFTSLSLAALAGLGLDAVQAKVNRFGRRASIGMGVLVLALAALEATPRGRYVPWIEISSPSNMPAVYLWLAEQSDVSALVELPMLAHWREAERMYYWSIHGRPLVNGYSAYLPAAYQNLRASLLDFPGPESAARLQRLGVSHVVIHLDQLSRRDRRSWEVWQREMEKLPDPWMRRIHEEGAAMIYRITPKPLSEARDQQEIGGPR